MSDSVRYKFEWSTRMEPRVLVHDTIFITPSGQFAFIPSGGIMMVPTTSEQPKITRTDDPCNRLD